MRRVILSLIVVVLALSVGLAAAACSNVNQINFISVVAREYECYTYTVYEKKDMVPIGTFVYTFRRFDADDATPYTIGDKQFQVTSGGVITTQLHITEGKYAGETVNAQILFKDAYTPIASQKVYEAYTDGAKDDSRSYVSFIDYTDKKNISITVNDVTESFKKPSYCYDNDTLYSLARGSDVTRSDYSLSVAGVDNLQGGTRSVSLSRIAGTVKRSVPYISAEDIETTCVKLTAAAQYGTGSEIYVYFLPSYHHTDSHGVLVDLNKVPVCMDEGNYTYVLSGISTEAIA